MGNAHQGTVYILVQLDLSYQKKETYYKNLALANKAKTVREGRLKVILLQQVSSDDFEPTFIILVLILYCQTIPNKNK